MIQKYLYLYDDDGGSTTPTNKSSSRVKLLFWRETSAQHFNNTSGDWTLDTVPKYGKGCIPLRHNRTESIRTQWMRDALLSNNVTTNMNNTTNQTKSALTSLRSWIDLSKTSKPLKPKEESPFMTSLADYCY